MLKNNDILRRVRYALDLKDSTMVKIFEYGGMKYSKEEIKNILKREEEDDFLKCNNKMLEAFLEGFIILKRGKQKQDPNKKVEVAKITKNNINNVILRKLRIADRKSVV